MDSEKPTDPNGMMISQEDILSYMVGAVQRIESQLVSEEPPPWIVKLFEKLSERISSLEDDIKKIKSTCSSRHENNQIKLPLI